MKSKIPAVLILCVLSVVPALAQTSSSSATNVATVPDWFIFASRPLGTISQFVSPVQNSGVKNIVQSSTGNIGIGISAPLFPLHIFSSSTIPPPGHNQPVTLWVETSAPNTQGAIQALASAGTGNTLAVNGATFSPDGVGVLGNRPNQRGRRQRCCWPNKFRYRLHYGS